MENEILQKIRKQDEKLAKIYASVEKTRKYFLWTLIISIITIVLPIIALVLIIPWFLRTMMSAYSI